MLLASQQAPRREQGAGNDLGSYVEDVVGVVCMLPKGPQGLHITAPASSRLLGWAHKHALPSLQSSCIAWTASGSLCAAWLVTRQGKSHASSSQPG